MSSSKGPRTVVLVSGGGTNLQAIMDEVAAGLLGIQICAVLSDKPGAYALERARNAKVPCVIVDFAGHRDRASFEQKLADELDRLKPDIIVLAGFMRILPTDLVERYRGRMLNIHPSLLPDYPGLHTHRRVLANGDKMHGSTVHFVTPELDSGPGIIRYRVAVRPDDTEASLATRVQAGEYIIYPRAIGWLASGRIELRGEDCWLDDMLLRAAVTVEEIR